jgi:hypothetical protein
MGASQQALLAGGGVAFPEFVSAGSVQRVSSASSITVPAPTSRPDGSKIIIVLFATSVATVSSAPSGFNQVFFNNSTLNTFAVYEKTASAESGDYTFTWSTSVRSSGVALAYSVVGSFTVGAGARVNDTVSVASSISPTLQGVLLQMFATEVTSTVSVAPSGTSRALFTANDPSLAIYEISPQAAGATGTKQITWGTKGDTFALLIQLTNP